MTAFLLAPLLIGFILYFYEEIIRAFLYLKDNYKSVYNRFYSFAPKKKAKLKKRVKIINGGTKTNFIIKSYNQMTEILKTTGAASQVKIMRQVSLLCGALGCAAALYLKSVLLLPILGIGLALVPMWLMKFKMYRYEIRMQNELSVVLSMVTNSYVRNENIVKAVSENLTYMNEPVKSIFATFVYSNSFVNADIGANLLILKTKINNKIFKLWCENLILCQKDINQKYSLDAVVTQFVADKELYNMLSSEISKPMGVLLAIVGLTSLAFPLIGMIGSQFEVVNIFGILFSNVYGQIVVTGYIISVLYGLNMAIDLSTQIE